MDKNIHLLIIDPQNDFCIPEGSLYVDGAEKDMGRLTSFIDKNMGNISRITVTLDSHKNYHIANPIFWIDEEGKHPQPFTIITSNDVDTGRWQATNSIHRSWSINYVKTLEKKGRYQLCIWPYHCIIGTKGNNIFNSLAEIIRVYEIEHKGIVEYIIKGSNSLTEHYSALFADVPIPDDVSTQINKSLLVSMAESETIYVAGEALSHCVANTILDIGTCLNSDLSKFTLLQDATSSVKGFEHLSDNFIYTAKKMGLKFRYTTD